MLPLVEDSGCFQEVVYGDITDEHIRESREAETVQWLHAEGKVLVSHVGVVTLYRQDITVCSPDPTEVGEAHTMLWTCHLFVLRVQHIKELCQLYLLV